MPVGQGGYTSQIGKIDLLAFLFERIDGSLDVGGVPEGDDVEHEPESAEFLLLPFAVGGADFAPSAMTDPPCQFVAKLMPVELGEDTPAFFGVVDVIEDMKRFDETAQFGQSACEGSGPVLDLQDAHDSASLDAAELKRCSETQKIIPAFFDQVDIDTMTGHRVERSVVGLFVDPPGDYKLPKASPERGVSMPSEISCVGHDDAIGGDIAWHDGRASSKSKVSSRLSQQDHGQKRSRSRRLGITQCNSSALCLDNILCLCNRIDPAS